MATTRTYDPACYDLAKKFLTGCPDLNDENVLRRVHLMALEIQQCIEDEINFQRSMLEAHA